MYSSHHGAEGFAHTCGSPGPPGQGAEAETQGCGGVYHNAAVFEVPQELLEGPMVRALSGGVHGYAAGEGAKYLPIAEVSRCIEELRNIHRTVCMHGHLLALDICSFSYEQGRRIQPKALRGQRATGTAPTCRFQKKKRKKLKLHADPEGYELHIEAVVGPVTLVGRSKDPQP